MSKTIKNMMFVCLLFVFAFLPFVFAGCNEKEIEEYKTQIATLQEQNTSLQEQNTNYGTQVAGLQQQKTQLEQQNSSLQEQKTQLEQQNSSLEQQNSSLQEQVDTIHSPTKEERDAHYYIQKAITDIKKPADDDIGLCTALKNHIQLFAEQFWGVELNKILNINMSDLVEYKIQIIIEESAIKLNVSIEQENQIEYEFITINYNKQEAKNESVVFEMYNPSNSKVESCIYNFNDSSFEQQEYTSGSIFEEVKQKALTYEDMEANLDVALATTIYS